MARKHVTMALSGDGGDEVFGGYDSYRYYAVAEAYRKVPSPLRAVLRTTAGKLNGSIGNLGKRVRRFVEEAELPVEQAWLHSCSIFTDAELSQLYTPEFSARTQIEQRGFQIYQSFDYFRPAGMDTTLLNYVDYETYLPGDILVKVDRMSMANSLELRAPLLDYRIAEFAAGLPRDWKWNATEGKRILKRAARTVLPSSVLTRRKHGFVAPIASWLRGELNPFVREVIGSSRAGHVVRLDYCQQLLERHELGEFRGLERKLWSVLCYLLWHEKFAD
jgi:asparagine synthase (glutamine-hydrolysing)